MDKKKKNVEFRDSQSGCRKCKGEGKTIEIFRPEDYFIRMNDLKISLAFSNCAKPNHKGYYPAGIIQYHPINKRFRRIKSYKAW